MKLENISYALRAVEEVARTSERLLDEYSASRRSRAWPMLIGLGVGVAVGVAMSNDVFRERVKAWIDDRIDRDDERVAVAH